ncbi:MAG: lipopolysaccharide biosynthesis protein [Gaiellaceae bacterium]
MLGVREAGRVLRDFAAYLPTHAIPALTGFIVLPVLARKLTPSELGLLAILQTLASLGWTISASWLAAAVIRELPASLEVGAVASFRRVLARGLVLVAGALAFFALLIATGSIFSADIAANYPYLIAATAGLTLENISIALFAGSLRPRAYATFELTVRLTAVSLGMALVFAGHGIGGYLAGLATSTLLLGTIGIFVAWPRDKGAPREARAHGDSIRVWLSYGVPASAAATAVWAMTFVDRYVLVALRSKGAVAVYTVANIIGDKIVSIPMMAFFAAAAPLFFTAFERGGRMEVERLMREYTRVIMLIGLAAIAYVAASASDAIALLTGKSAYQAGAHVAPVVAAGALLYGLGGVASIGLAVARRMQTLIYCAAIGLVVNVVANLILIPPFGIMGAAIATPVATGTYLAAVYWFARPHASWHFPYATLGRAAVASIVGYGAAEAIGRIVASHVAGIIAMAAVGLPVYLLTLAVLGETRSVSPLPQSAQQG